MKKQTYYLMALTSLLLLVGLTACTSTPPHAASTKTWVIESPDGSIKQTWSDAIHIPACNKKDFDGGTEDSPKADCRSYTYEGRTCYYYSWTYVDGSADKLCPSPWRVPTREDFESLHDALELDYRDAKSANAKYTAAWGGVYGGGVQGRFFHVPESQGYYWSSSALSSGIAYGKSIGKIDYLNPGYGYLWKYYGFQVRCVK